MRTEHLRHQDAYRLTEVAVDVRPRRVLEMVLRTAQDRFGFDFRPIINRLEDGFLITVMWVDDPQSFTADLTQCLNDDFEIDATHRGKHIKVPKSDLVV